MFRIVISFQAEKRLAKLPKAIGNDIVHKIHWLAVNVRTIRHERLKGHPEYSLHAGQYRILYTIEWAEHCVIIEDIDKHDQAYRRLRGR